MNHEIIYSKWNDFISFKVVVVTLVFVFRYHLAYELQDSTKWNDYIYYF